MVVAHHISYLRHLASLGTQIFFTVSVNLISGIQKFKIIADPTKIIPLGQQHCTYEMLELLSRINMSHSIADKGHKHSNGQSEVKDLEGLRRT